MEKNLDVMKFRVIFEGVNPEIVKMTEFLTHEVIKQLKAISNVVKKKDREIYR